MESGQEGKDFFQPFRLDSGYPEQFLRSVKPSETRPLRQDRDRGRIGDPRQVPQFLSIRPVDIDPVSQQIFLADTDRRPPGSVHGLSENRIGIGENTGNSGRNPRYGLVFPPERLDSCCAKIPDQNDQG